jgi:uncharacterized protein YecE (DUF72 family)
MRRAFVGTSGWSYRSWQPDFYPDRLPSEDFLAFYAERLLAVEVNVTKYWLPSEEQFRHWAKQVPSNFRFAVTAPDRFEQRIPAFEKRVRALGDRLGCVRVVRETPQRDDGWLELLIGTTDPRIRYALDLRDPSWDGIEPHLTSYGWARVGDAAGAAGWAYLRFRDPPWDETKLTGSAATIRRLAEATAAVYAFFQHEDVPRAPLAAVRTREILAGIAAPTDQP